MTECRCWVAVLALACLCALPLSANDGSDCWAGAKRTFQKDVSGFTLWMTPITGAANRATGEGCRAQIVNTQHKVIFSATDWGFSIVLAGKDVNGDGIPDLVLESDSGGMHGTNTYYVFSFGQKPELILKFQTEAVPARFIPSRTSNGMEVQTWDGAFFMFDHQPTAGSPYPLVYFRMDDNRLIDISSQHLADYDKKIRELKADISAEELKTFFQAENESEKAGLEHTASQVLRIVLAYLYSGRQSQARAELRKMWPVFDQERVWKLILQTRRRGILRYMAKSVS